MKQERYILGSGIELAYIYEPRGNSTVVFLHGYNSTLKSTKLQMLRELCREQNFGCMSFSYSGHGESSGTLEQGNIGMWANQSLELIDSLRSNTLYLIGSSMGFWLVLLIYPKLAHRVKGVMGIAPAPDFVTNILQPSLNVNEQILLDNYQTIWRCSPYGDDYPVNKQFFEDADKNRVLNKSMNLSCSVKLIHGCKDEVIPWQTSLQLMSVINSSDITLKLIAHAHHRLSDEFSLQQIRCELKNMIQGEN